MTINRHLQNPSTGEPFRAHRTRVGRGKLSPLGGELCLAEGPMTITVFDPRTGKPVIVTVPDKLRR
jgi:hypothetical protein